MQQLSERVNLSKKTWDCF